MENEIEKLCEVCEAAPIHGYVTGSGIYLSRTCYKCYKKRRGKEAFYETGSTKRGKAGVGYNNKEDK